jgi:hypothetical protein
MTRRSRLLLIGAALTVAVAELFHGPLGAAAELEASVESKAARALAFYELPGVTAQLDEKPLSRRLILNGPADDFQRRASVELLGQLPGVNEVRWQPGSPVVDHWKPKAPKP